GNELKPDCHFGYSNSICPGRETVNFRGRSMTVPKIDYSRAERFLNKVLEYNEKNPEQPIRVRGHVLVWHSQTPEWFFHEDYDASKPYVTKDEMDCRQEWYIKTILEHYLGKDSKYKDLFYGWDVVNEAASDSGDMVYRDDINGTDKLTDPTHGSKSSWWHIYQSNEFIINAFKYANKYAPADVELYYNDYGEISPSKSENICELIRAVKEKEGAPGEGTRIDAFGMQGHYGMADFSIQNFEEAARKYLDLLGKVQLTELDLKASAAYDGTEATKDQEYQDQSMVYKSIFECLQKLEQEEGYDITGITFWGVTDPTSWLQSRNSVGGGADGLKSQCPLLFDGKFEPKPAFWAFVDPSRIKVAQKTVEIRRSYDGKFKDGVEYTFEGEGISAAMIPVWDEEGLKIQVEVKDRTDDKDGDFVTVYLDETCTGSDNVTPLTVSCTRAQGYQIGGGYKTVITVPLTEIHVGKELLFDVRVTDQHQGEVNFNDIQASQERSSANYAFAALKPAFSKVSQAPGMILIDGRAEEAWDNAEVFWLNIGEGDVKSAARVRLLWDQKKLYVYAEVQDAELCEGEDADYLEIFIDEDHGRGAEYAKDDKWYRIDCGNQLSFGGKKASEKNVESKTEKTADGYVVEASFSWTAVKPKVHNLIGIELRVNDADASGRQLGTLNWYDETNGAEKSPACFGTIKLAVAREEQKADEAGDTDAGSKAGMVNPDAEFATAKGFASDDGTGVKSGEETPDHAKAGSDAGEQGAKSGAVGLLGICAAVILLIAGAVIFVRRGKGKNKPEEPEKKS
ncbi:MAG: endo-1,4-beta-xylanase, partial [Lachnospiraceae bacterium]|nr:endo-1,4-beta-xylanase [Lachnospiraceae bacterium]